jgi:4-amino-4-deoxy-L-arabinose transferase-like glycosyltransferase
LPINRKNLIWFVITILIALVGMAAVTYQSREGSGVTGDSVYYVMGARNILSGNGYSRYSGGWEPVPITGFPPVFSVLLAGAGFFGGDLFESARIINILLFGANIFLAGFLTFRYTRTILPAIISSLLIMASASMIHYHSWVMTEGLFIFLTLLSLITLVRYFETDKLLYLVITGLLLAVSTLTRYVGLACVGMAVLGILIFSHLGWKKRLIHIVVLGLVSVTPFILWLYRNSLVSNSLVNRQIVFHFMSRELVLGFISEAVSWFAPRILNLPRFLDAALFLIFAVVIPLLFIITEVKHGVLRKGSPWQGFNILPFLILLFIPTYVILLVLNTTLLDASTSLTATHRYLLPVFAMMVIMLTCMVFRLVENKSRGVKITSLVIAVLFFGFFLSELLSFLRGPVKDMGYTDIKRSWTNVVGALNQIDSSHLFISDNVELFYFLAGRPAYAFPISYDNYTQQERQDFNDQIAKARNRLEQGAIIVLFYPEEGQKKALEQLGVETLYEFPQATFYHLPGK